MLLITPEKTVLKLTVALAGLAASQLLSTCLAIDSGQSSAASLLFYDGLAIATLAIFVRKSFSGPCCAWMVVSSIFHAVALEVDFSGFLETQSLCFVAFFLRHGFSSRQSLWSAICVLASVIEMNYSSIPTLLYLLCMLLGLERLPHVSEEARRFPLLLFLSGVFASCVGLLKDPHAASLSTSSLFLAVSRVAVFLSSAGLRGVSRAEISVGMVCLSNMTFSLWKHLSSDNSAFTTKGTIVTLSVLFHMCHLRKYFWPNIKEFDLDHGRSVGRLDYLGAEDPNLTVSGSAGGFVQWGLNLAAKEIVNKNGEKLLPCCPS